MIETAQRIRIIGGSGSGKTYLAKLISNHNNLKYLNLDELYWSKGKKRNEIERNNLLKESMKHEKWIIEGSYDEEWVSSTLTDSTTIIILKVTLLKRLIRIITKYFSKMFSQEETIKQLIIKIGETINYNKKHLIKLTNNKYIQKKSKTFSNAEEAYKFYVKETAPDLFL